MKKVPNILTITRIILACLMIVFFNNKDAFIVLFIVACITDALDGFIARKFNAISEFGAKLDSSADFLLYMVVLFNVLHTINIDLGIFLYLIIAIIVIRVFNTIFSLVKYHKIIFLHTIGAKITGVIFFLSFVIFYSFKYYKYFYLVVILSLISSLEELLIFIKRKEISTDIKTIFN